MNLKNRRARRWQTPLAALLITFLLFGQTSAQVAATTAPAKLSVTETQVTERISVDTIKEITAALAADEMQGRGTMQPGGDKAANYIADRFQKLGLNRSATREAICRKLILRKMFSRRKRLLRSATKI